jgi:hypothetical protein
VTKVCNNGCYIKQDVPSRTRKDDFTTAYISRLIDVLVSLNVIVIVLFYLCEEYVLKVKRYGSQRTIKCQTGLLVWKT